MKSRLKLIELPCTERYARWCERSEIFLMEKFPPTCLENSLDKEGLQL